MTPTSPAARVNFGGLHVTAILQQLRIVAHNCRVTDSNPDPPDSLSAAEERFKTFLATQNYPKAICWLMPGDVVVDTKRRYCVRKRERRAQDMPLCAIPRGLYATSASPTLSETRCFNNYLCL
jgi:hypothetical protein